MADIQQEVAMDKFRQIRVPILNDEYWVTVCWGEWTPEAEIVIKGLTEGNADTCNVQNQRGLFWAHEGWKYQPVIYITLPVHDSKFFSTLSHEAVHCINALWDKLEEPSKEEVFAYSVGAIVAAVEREVRK